MASKSAPGPPSTSVRRARFKPVSLDPLSRVIYTQTLTALKPLRATTLDDPAALRSTLAEHRNQLSTLVSTIGAADAEGLNEQQKLALNLGKLATLFSKRLAAPLNTATFRRPTVSQTTVSSATAVRRRPTVPPPASTVLRKRAVAPVAAPAKKIKDEPLDEDEPCCSSSTANGTFASTNETLSSLLDAQLRSMQQQSRVVAAPQSTPRPTITVARAAPGAAPVRVVVANRNGGAAARVVAVRRPVPAQKVAVATPRPTVSADSPAPTSGQRVAAVATRPTAAELRAKIIRLNNYIHCRSRATSTVDANV